jgi:putative endonuclease
MAYYIYVMSDEDNARFLIGACSNLLRKIHEHKTETSGKCAELDARKLIYFEQHKDYTEAKRREKEIRSWDDEYMKQIIRFKNPDLRDVYNDLNI